MDEGSRLLSSVKTTSIFEPISVSCEPDDMITDQLLVDWGSRQLNSAEIPHFFSDAVLCLNSFEITV